VSAPADDALTTPAAAVPLPTTDLFTPISEAHALQMPGTGAAFQSTPQAAPRTHMFMPTSALATHKSACGMAPEVPEELWEARKLEEVRETAAAQERLQPLTLASSVAVGALAAQVRELRGLGQQVDAARAQLAWRVEMWDADELAPKWAATASWLHPKDEQTAALLERRRIVRHRAEQLLRSAPSVTATLPDRITKLVTLQSRCAEVQAALLPPTVLMAEEVLVADALAALAFVASSGLGPRSTVAGAQSSSGRTTATPAGDSTTLARDPTPPSVPTQKHSVRFQD
jgi:hypothetical protein